jgi:ElaB/YqjD/DUF883 family membrane-anchored ribosome-binding protein
MADNQETTKERASRGASATAHQGASDTATVRDKVQEGVAQVRDKTQELGDQAKELGVQAQQAAKELGVQAQQAAVEYYQQGREGLVDLQHTIEAQIHEKPVQSLLIAGGIGLLLGLLWRRS